LETAAGRRPGSTDVTLSAMKVSFSTLRQIGCVIANNLSSQRVRVLSLPAITETRDSKELQKYFDS
jgi:hypothetical protein